MFERLTLPTWRKPTQYTALFLLFLTLPACHLCGIGGQSFTAGPAPTFNDIIQTAPSGGTLQVGPEVSVLAADGSSEVGLGVRCDCANDSSPVGLAFGASKYFPEVGSGYGAWVGAKYTRPSEGPVNLFGTAGPVWSRAGYSSLEYEIPTGEFGGGAFQQGLGDDSQNAYGVRVGVGAELDRSGSPWKPYGEVGYDVFLGGAEFSNQVRLSAGLTYSLGGGDR